MSLNLHLEESTVRSERMTPFKYSTAHVKVMLATASVVCVCVRMLVHECACVCVRVSVCISGRLWNSVRVCEQLWKRAERDFMLIIYFI